MAIKRAVAGQLTSKSAPICSHMGNWELLLIRIGHHLWREYKAALRRFDGKSAYVYSDACTSVWAAKAEYRKPLLQARAKNHAETVSRFAKRRQQNGLRDSI